MQQFNLELSLENVNLILQGLSELPAKISMGVIGIIQNQANVQLKEMEETIPEVKPDLKVVKESSE